MTKICSFMKYLNSNIRHLRNLKNLSQEKFADELGWTKSSLGSYEESRSEPSIDRLCQLSDYAKIPIDVLIKNDLRLANTTTFIEIGNKRILFPITVNAENENMIEIVPVKASAGYANGYDDPEYISNLEKISLPFLKSGKYRAFPIKGDSMLPMKSGDIIVGNFIENFASVKTGKTYIIVTANDGIVYKRVFKPKGNLNVLQLVSDNKMYEPYTLHWKEIIEIWAFSCCINRNEFDQQEIKLSTISTLLENLNVEVKELEKILK